MQGLELASIDWGATNHVDDGLLYSRSRQCDQQASLHLFLFFIVFLISFFVSCNRSCILCRPCATDEGRGTL